MRIRYQVASGGYHEECSLDLGVSFGQNFNCKIRVQVKCHHNCTPSTEIAHIVEKDALYEQLHTVQEGLIEKAGWFPPAMYQSWLN